MNKVITIFAIFALTGCAYQKSQYVLDIENAPVPTTPEATTSECARIYDEIDKNNQAMARSYQDGSFTMKAQNEKDARNEALSIRTFKIGCPRR
ncbi:hypothetical protein FHJ31_12855 [Pseudomonas sp. Fig-3]|jgi:hypothetical protein|uniref:Lipoprotein n=1 Tax=Pseudomonas rhizophila TaxID=2045200 RepID=A0ABN5JUN6_9PSED|nr:MULTISPECIES: hypothetical protein [Pseudomonas]AVU76344.1 hypothetical protein CRX69_14505 [Pseudomonas rhizophila]MXR28439.1 hypothetical protein [Pseudomonas sp. PICF6]QKJ35198.1 hypothetical protein HQ912_10310 [Pseudomonas sp. MPDS]TNB84725.1 hypothetical protein FHJ31_12855 [Pseudomonas sp. Fig-3]WLG21619.1 hypothetical protein PSH91_17795 [Pseudomonas sp. FP1154]